MAKRAVRHGVAPWLSKNGESAEFYPLDVEIGTGAVRYGAAR
jgi:hypothetical protein